jgi:dTMP kinase
MFINFEGVDGSGKTTQLKMLADYLTSKQIDYTSTKEPGGTELADKLRELIIHEEMSELTRLLLVNASRLENVKQIIQPALKAGRVVLCDRFVDSTLVYQGLKAGLGVDIVQKMHAMLLNNIMPDVTFYLSITPEQALERISSRELFNNFDKQTAQNIHLMIDCYESIYFKGQNSDLHSKTQIVKINAYRAVESVFSEIKTYINKALGLF